ncbi:DUF1194 domain-containing protein [Nordella sp. HKS 07]|uniref:DUF1194 domain-containing protein n=1 Tax=Nordella sp. HKS 07 TaxID=2712222 RepID=UPI001FEE7EB3|nr:DUF1194 domain-containing protein [Nordella sp. HKS 07]
MGGMLLRLLMTVLALAFSLRVGLAADTQVDLELVLAVDVSRSMDADEQALQRNGYIQAFRHQEVIDALSSGPYGRIAVSYVEWAGPSFQQTIVPWMLIDGEAAAHAFADRLAAAPISRERGTSIANGLLFVGPTFEGNGIAGSRRVIDVSGDGPNNMGVPVQTARDPLVAAGVTINGLPIMIKRAGGFASIENLDIYYEDCVIGGPGAFLVTVTDIKNLASAIRRKLVLEIATRPVLLQKASETEPETRIDCMIGERLREQWMRE